MIRFAPLSASALFLLMLAPAAAQSRAHYTATAAVAPKKSGFTTQNTIWKCADAVCTAPKSTSQDKIMCERAVQRVGALTAFSVGGIAFDGAALAACNARAK